MSRRSKFACLALLLLLVGMAGWSAIQRGRRSQWVAELQKQGVRATTEPAYQGAAENLPDLCWSLYAGECVQVLVDNETDAKVLLAAAKCPGRLQILTFLDLSAECFGGLQDHFPSAEMVALLPKEVFEEDSLFAKPPAPMPITRIDR